MRSIYIKLIIFFLVGFGISWSLDTIALPNSSNPLHPTISIRDALIVWRNKDAIHDCVQMQDQTKVFECINVRLRHISRIYGAKPALALIEPISQNSPIILTLGHDLAHTIGDNALYAPYGMKQGIATLSQDELLEKIGRVIVDCDGWGSFGCYHGVIEVALSRIGPNERTAMIRKACLEHPLVRSKQFYLNQCMHWFGHSMAIFTDQTLEQTLAMCEGVSPSFQSDEVQLCLSGVFHAGALPGTSDQEYLGNVSRLYKRDDPYFPCLDVEERFKQHCFGHVVGRSRTGDVEVITRNCDGIPESNPEKKKMYIKGCYESMGNNLLIGGNFTAQGVSDACRAYGDPAYDGFCYGGAARYHILRDPLINNDLPFAICKLAPLDAKHTCYSLIGFANFENYKSKAILESFCAHAESEFVDNCMQLNPWE